MMDEANDKILVSYLEYLELAQEPGFDHSLFRVDRSTIDPADVSLQDFLDLYNLQNAKETPDVHRRIADWLESTHDKRFRLLMAHRRIAKSYLMSIYTSWCIYRDPTYNTIILSGEEDGAKNNSKFIRKILENHKLTPHLVPDVRKRSALWQITQFEVVSEKDLQHPTVQVGSILGSITGKHSDHLVADDVEQSSNSKTAESRKAVRERIAEFLDLSQKVTFIGTPHAGMESIYRDRHVDPDYETLIIPVYTEDDQGLRIYAWPKAHPLDREGFDDEKMRALEKEQPHGYHRSQYFLEFVNIEASTLDPAFIHRYDYEPVIKEGKAVEINGKPIIQRGALAAWDYAAGNDDDSVVSILYRDNTDQTYVHRIEAMPPNIPGTDTGYSLQITRCLSLCKQFGITRLVIEVNNAGVLAADVRREISKQKLGILVEEYRATGSGQSGGSKANRIAAAVEPVLSGGRLHAHRSAVETGKLIEQLQGFPDNCIRRRGKDDWIDSLGIGLTKLGKVPHRLSEGGRRSHQIVHAPAATQINQGGANRLFRRPAPPPLGFRSR